MNFFHSAKIKFYFAGTYETKLIKIRTRNGVFTFLVLILYKEYKYFIYLSL